MSECRAVAGTMRGAALIISNNILRLGQQVLLQFQLPKEILIAIVLHRAWMSDAYYSLLCT